MVRGEYFMFTATVTQGVQGLRALDPELPFLASEAAVDLDNLLANRARDFSAIQRLADRLKISVENSSSESARVMDPATLNLLDTAMVQSRAFASGKVADVLSQAAKIAGNLAAVDSSQNPAELEQARDFCVALSQAAASYRRSISDLRQSHPFRR